MHFEEKSRVCWETVGHSRAVYGCNRRSQMLCPGFYLFVFVGLIMSQKKKQGAGEDCCACVGVCVAQCWIRI